MVRALVFRGAGVGVLAGLVAFLFARIFAEPLIQAAIDYEGGRAEAEAALAAAAGQPPSGEEPELFSRAVQGNLGIGIGMVAFGLAIGLFFAVAFCMAYGRTGNVRPRQLSLLVGLFGFLAIFAVPFVKYPANPPAVGNPDTIGQRTAWYFCMLAVSVVAAIIALVVTRRLAPRFGSWSSGLTAAGGYLVVVGLTARLLPVVDEVPATFPADLLWQFRIASLTVQATLWAVIGLTLATMIGSVVRRSAGASRTDQLAGSAA
jgi:predicted cobalt transporter CbtA